jgi:hypothetical protein
MASRLASVGAVAAIVALVLNLAIEWLGRLVLGVPPSFKPYTGVYLPAYTLGGVAIACVAFWLVTRASREPVRTYTRVAAVALVVSWLPSLYLLTHPGPGVTLLAVGTLLLMHTVTALITIVAFTRFALPAKG